MDKNQAIGLVLITALLLIYFQFFSRPPITHEPLPADTLEAVPAIPEEAGQTLQPEKINTRQDSLLRQQRQQSLGIFSQAAQGSPTEVVLENEDIRVVLNSQGGIVKEVLLKKFLTSDKQPLVLLDEASSYYTFKLPSLQDEIELSQLFFRSDRSRLDLSGSDSSEVTLTMDLGNGRWIKQTYGLQGTGYQLGYRLEMHGLDDELVGQTLFLEWTNNIKAVEENLLDSRNTTTINYYTVDGQFDYLSERSTDPEEEQLDQAVKWFSFKQHFFTTGLVAADAFSGGYVRTMVDPTDSSVVKNTFAAFALPLNQVQQSGANFEFYFGPNNYQILKKVTAGFSENVYLGWSLFSWFNKYLIIPIFNFLEQYISNYGIIIVILVLIIKVILSPLSYKSYLSMAKQKVMKPEIDELKKKYGDDMQKVQAEQMKLFQQVGVNPLSGCIPLLLQMPILLAMFNFFPNSIELRQESFLWAHDLSTYDSILDLPFTIPFYGSHVSLFTILMTGSTILYTWMNNQMTTVQGPMKSISYMMPVMFMFILNSFSAGLTFYYFVQNMVTFGQQALIKRFIDEEKIRQVLDENRKRNVGKKKSKFQTRLEEAMKAKETGKKRKVR